MPIVTGKRERWRVWAAHLALASGLALGTLGFIVLTNNSPANGLALVPLVVGLAWLAACGAVTLRVGSRAWWRPSKATRCASRCRNRTSRSSS